MRNLIRVLATITILFVTVPVQQDQAKDIRLEKNKPTVYLTFERAGRRKQLRVWESSHGLWFRLHNSSLQPIAIRVFDLPEDKDVVKESDEIGVCYDVDVERESPHRMQTLPVRKAKKIEAPEGYQALPYTRGMWIESGRSVLFSIPREHLADKLRIYVRFNYAWEVDHSFTNLIYVRGMEPEHRVYFSYTSLPANAIVKRKGR